MYFTLFKVDGSIVPLKRKPTIERLRKLLDCRFIESSLFGFYYNGKDHQDAEIAVDDFSLSDHKPINLKATEGASRSMFWKNMAYKHDYGGRMVICGNAVIVTQEPLIE